MTPSSRKCRCPGDMPRPSCRESQTRSCSSRTARAKTRTGPTTAGDEIVLARTLPSAGGENPDIENDCQIDEDDDSWNHRGSLAGSFCARLPPTILATRISRAATSMPTPAANTQHDTRDRPAESRKGAARPASSSRNPDAKGKRRTRGGRVVSASFRLSLRFVSFVWTLTIACSMLAAWTRLFQNFWGYTRHREAVCSRQAVLGTRRRESRSAATRSRDMLP